MMVYVAEIKGRGIAAFQADNASDAEQIVRDQLFRDDLAALISDGLPLWDCVADIRVRQARPDEEARWRASRAKAIRHGDIEGEEEVGSLSSLHSPIRSDVETVIESRAAADWIRGAEGLHQYDYLLRTKFWVGAASLLGYRLRSRHSGADSARAVEIHGKQNQGDAAKGRSAGNRGS